MVRTFPFHQVDVFTDQPHRGNPLAVVLGAQGLDDADMAAFARWTNLSETTFVSAATDPAADYAVRIFTPARELPFAGHPTLGSCHAWLAAGGKPRTRGLVVQQCGIGLVRIRDGGNRLAFAAPPLLRTGPLDEPTIERIVAALGVRRSQVVASQWVDNGPGWQAVLLDAADTVLRARCDAARLGDIKLGVIGPWPPGSECAFEVRAFVPGDGIVEDPVTGSLNAGLAQWLVGAGLAPPRYVAAQGTALGRAGRVFVERDDDGRLWIGGAVQSVVEGTVRF